VYLLLSEALPLRTTRALGPFAVDEVLPLRFGDLRDTRFELLKLDDSRWFVADHVMEVTAVYINDEATLSYAVETVSDVEGHTWTIVRLAAPAPADARVSASGLGLRDDDTGELIENPAAIMEYLLRIAGRDDLIFPLLRSETSEQGIVFAGSIDTEQTIRAWLDDLAYSCGAIWQPQLARLYPITIADAPIFDLTIETDDSISVTTSLDDTADVLRVKYGWNSAIDRPQSSIELTANPQRFGGVAAERTLKWLRLANNAESVGRRMLQRMAGVRYSITLKTKRVELRPCQWTRIVAHPGWPIAGADPVPMLLSVDASPNDNTARHTSEWIKSYPEIAVTAHTVALPDTRGGSVEIAVRDGIIELTITENDGSTPLKDALVSLDGGPARRTDESGKVTFFVTPSVPPKKHQIEIDAPGKEPVKMDFLL